jgi:hypothetical protein
LPRKHPGVERCGVVMFERTRKKLRQAEFFLPLLGSEQGRLSRTEASDFYLSAFLSAARSVVASLRQEYPEHYAQWLPAWYLDLSQDDRQLLNVCLGRDDMGSALDIETGESRASFGRPPQDFDTQEILILVEAERSKFPARREITVPARCRKYLDLLKRLVSEFEQVNLVDASNGEPRPMENRAARSRS